MLSISAKLHTIRLKIISLSGKSYPYYFIIAAIIAAFFNPFFIILVLFLLYMFKTKYNYKILLILILLIGISFTANYLIKSFKPKNIINGTVIEINQNNIIVKTTFSKYKLKTNNDYQIGDILEIEGTLTKPRGVRVPYGFNEKNYLRSRGVYYEINQAKINKIGFSYLYFPHLLINRYLDIYPLKTKVYLRSFIVGTNEYNREFKDATNKLQITYLLSLSGILIYAILNILKKIFFYLDIKTKKQDVIIIFLLFIWCVIAGFKFVILRIFIISLLTNINKYLNLKMTRLDIIFYAFLSLIIGKPDLLYSTGFTISFVVLTMVSLVDSEIKIGNYFIKRYVLYVLIYLSILPIIINMYNNIYLLIFILTPLLVLIFQKGIIYLFIVVLAMPFLSFISEFYLFYFENIIKYISGFKSNLTFPNFNNIFILTYYLIFIFFMSNKKWINKNMFSLILLVLIVYNKAYLNPTYKLIFLDVDQGDTTIFITPYNQEVIVIDAYGSVLSTLNKMGVRKIDYLILTHPDNDHVREANNLISNLAVEKVLINPYDSYDLIESNFIKIKDEDKIINSNFEINFLSPNKNYYNNNDNSLAFQLKYLNNKVLFLGDISKNVEIEMIKRYGGILESNILKLAHHGSNTSTSSNLLSSVKPKDIIISVGLNNIYGFPHKEVLELLDGNYNVYRTDINYTISYISVNNITKTLKHYENYIIYYIILEKKKGRFYG